MVFKHAVVAAFRIYAQCGEDAAKRGCRGCALSSHGNIIVDHGKSWKNHGIVFLNFCWNPERQFCRTNCTVYWNMSFNKHITIQVTCEN